MKRAAKSKFLHLPPLLSLSLSLSLSLPASIARTTHKRKRLLLQQTTHSIKEIVHERCMSVKLRLLYHVGWVVNNVGVVESLRLSCLLVCGDRL